MSAETKTIQRKILQWYNVHHRAHLPWRKTRDPYKILVSEVMLQQTQVERVIPKYNEFLRVFPNVQKLAEAKTADVIRIWKGLGYNRRALYLQRTAQAIVREYRGKFPNGLGELKKLPGIGEYTARAILSFAFEKNAAVLDTNHRRFYQRVFFGLRKRDDKALLVKGEEVINPSTNARDRTTYDWNQALMDFGSLVCLTGRPKCEVCPIQKYCKAYPKILKVKRKSEKSKRNIPFRESDRYFRGRMIDRLREAGKVAEIVMRQEFQELPDMRYRNILAKLEKDGLLVRKKGSILLP